MLLYVARQLFYAYEIRISEELYPTIRGVAFIFLGAYIMKKAPTIVKLAKEWIIEG